MKKHIVSIIVVFAGLAVAWSAFARAEETGGRRSPRQRGARDSAAVSGAETRPGREAFGLSADDRQRMRARFENMSEEEREKFRAEMRERFGGSRGGPPTGPSQYYERGGPPTGPSQYYERGGPPTGPSQYYDTSSRYYEQQIEQLKADHQKTIAELKEILALAKKEKATQTSKRLDALIAKRQNAFDVRLKGMEQRRQRFQRIRPDSARPGPPGRPDDARGPRGKKAPDFKLKSFDGKQISLSGLRGKIVVLEWLNFACPFSRYHYETKTTMADLAKKYKGKGVVWLAVNSTNQTSAAKNVEFAKKNKVPFPILNDIPGVVGKAYGAKTTPHIFIIDKAGSIAYNGAIDNAPMGKVKDGQEYVNYVSAALDALTAGRRVTTPQSKPYGCSVKYPK